MTCGAPISSRSKSGSQPARLKSPDWVLRYQVGTCFELSTLLVSLLIGNGYNAYVVSGYASKQQCQNDQTYTDCPENLRREFDELLDNTETTSNYSNEFTNITVAREKMGISKFWTMMEEREKAKAADQLQMKQNEEQKRIMEIEKIPPDELHGNRIHSWVLIIINKNDIKFIEPSTGVVHEVSDDGFIRIESLWNHLNYWVNVKPDLSLSEVSFDLTNLEYWEHLLVAEPWHSYSEGLKFTNKHDIRALKHFAMPFSWVRCLNLSKEKYEEKFPNGYKTILYKKLKVEKFCKHRESDGTILQITMYDDYDCKGSIMMVKMFSGRSDRLKKLKVNCKVGRALEYFEYGRNDSLKKLEYFKHAQPLWNGLNMKFYSISRLNNLISLYITVSEMKCNFINRNDRLLSYMVKFESTSPSETIEGMKNSIKKIGEKFAKQNQTRTIEIREFRKNEIVVTYHFEKKEIFQKKVFYPKEDLLSDMQAKTKKYNNNPEIEELAELLKLELHCTSEVLRLLQEVDEIFQRRCLESDILTTEK